MIEFDLHFVNILCYRISIVSIPRLMWALISILTVFFEAKLVNAINKHSHQNEKGDLSARQITHTPAAD